MAQGAFRNPHGKTRFRLFTFRPSNLGLFGSWPESHAREKNFQDCWHSKQSFSMNVDVFRSSQVVELLSKEFGEKVVGISLFH